MTINPTKERSEVQAEALVAVAILEGLMQCPDWILGDTAAMRTQMSRYMLTICNALEEGNSSRASEFAKFVLDEVASYADKQGFPDYWLLDLLGIRVRKLSSAVEERLLCLSR